MKQAHYTTLKLHAMFSIGLAAVFVFLMLIKRDLAFSLTLLFMFLYVSGNGIIHTKNNQLSKDTLIEYVLVALVILILVIDVLL